jgi:hypothetical protein
MFGAGKPKIIEWSQMKGLARRHRPPALLRGRCERGERSELVYTAVVDLYANRVVSIEPYSWGTSTAVGLAGLFSGGDAIRTATSMSSSCGSRG